MTETDRIAPEHLAPVLAGRAAWSAVTAEALHLLPEKGLMHDHLRVAGRQANGRGVLLRVPRMSQWGLAPADSLAYEATCFARAAPSDHTPRLLDIIAPVPELAFGALVVEEVGGRPPRLPGDMAAIAVALAAVHRLKLPPAGRRAPLMVHDRPAAGTLVRIEAQAAALDEMEMAAEARAAILAELDWARDFAAGPANVPQPLTLVLTDTHPGNFLIEADGRAVFVDLEKALYGAPAIDLAHATLYTSTMWDADCAAALAPEDVRAFYRDYLDAAGPELAEALGPWLLPYRRFTWLRTMTFCAQWRVVAGGRGDWPPRRLAPAHRAHLMARMEDYFAPATIARIRAEWLDSNPLVLN